jgi:dynein heavy chain 1
MSTVVGDVLLASAFLAYIGFFDQQFRSDLMKKWMARLNDAGVKFKTDLSVPDFLSKPEERLNWQANGLPAVCLFTLFFFPTPSFFFLLLVFPPSPSLSNCLLG